MSADAGAQPQRLQRLLRDELDRDQRAVYDAIAGGPRASGLQLFPLVDDDGCLQGPFNAFLLQPTLGDRLQALGAAIRYSTTLSDRARELAILVVAAKWRCEFEQYAHEAIGRAVGLTESEMEAIRAGHVADTEANWPDPVDLMNVRVVRALADAGDLSDATFQAAVDVIGEVGLFELLTLVGYYATLALQLRVFRVGAPARIVS
jgi:4-carboxymuconolactone decarboxylase